MEKGSFRVGVDNKNINKNNYGQELNSKGPIYLLGLFFIVKYLS